MLTIHQANGRGPRPDEGARARAVRRVAELRRLDPHLVDALADAANLDSEGRPKVLKLAHLLGRSMSEVRQDLATLRALATGEQPPAVVLPEKKHSPPGNSQGKQARHDARVLQAVKELGGRADRAAIVAAVGIGDDRVGWALNRLVKSGRLVGTMGRLPRGGSGRSFLVVVAAAIPAVGA